VLISAPIWLPVLAVELLWTLLASGRPILILHRRVGFRSSEIWIPKVATLSHPPCSSHKFMGMVGLATGVQTAGTHVLRRPARVTKTLRLVGADELPQLFSVLTGKMRLVGPRPVTPSEIIQMYGENENTVFDVVRPGLLGTWQVLDRHSYSLSERRILDERMVEDWSTSTQMRIAGRAILRLLPVMRENA
jgi:lipopolysaccharide/colanic/teichoic acid biosynthesis glycosyltransferase